MRILLLLPVFPSRLGRDLEEYRTQAGEEGNTSLENADVEDWVTVVQKKNKKLGSGVVVNRASDNNEDGGIGRLARRLREGEPTGTE